MNRLGLLTALAACAAAASSATETPAPPTQQGDAAPAPAAKTRPNGPLGLMVESGRANEGGIVYVKRPGRENDL